MFTPRLVVPLFVLGLALGACKEDEPTLDSGVDEAKPADQLTTEEQTSLCEASRGYYAQLMSESERREKSCTFSAILSSLFADGTAETCDTLRRSCLADPPQPDDEDGGSCTLGVDWANCKATVAELEACYEEYAEGIVAVMRSYSCAKMEAYKTEPPSSDVELGSACSLAKAKCASVLGGSSSEESVG